MQYYQSDAATSFSAPGVYLIGFGFDGTACFRKGAKKGPEAIRDVSDGIESYSPYLKRDTSDLGGLFDLGDLDVAVLEDIDADWLNTTEQFNKVLKNYQANTHKLLTLGGEHSISYAPIKKHLEAYDDLVLLHLDAHADLRDGYLGHHFSHASIMRRSLDHFGEGHELIQYGIRSGTKEEYQWMDKNKTNCQSLNEFCERVSIIPDHRPIYLTFDLDFFDPGVFPGTGTPEPGGENFHSFIKIAKILDTKNVVGADVVELAPELDSSGVSSVVATKVVRELLLILGKNG